MFYMQYATMSNADLEQEYLQVKAHFEECKNQHLKLNMARGKPSKLQRCIVSKRCRSQSEPY